MPAGATNHFVLPLDDPLLYDPYREYYVYIPAGYDNSKPLPVVYSMHGFYESAEAMMTEDRFSNLIEDELAAKNESFIVVWGQGMADCGKANCMGGGTYPERAWNTWGQAESPGPRGHTCNQHRNRFGRYGCFTSCRMRANMTTQDACFLYGKNSTVSGYDHCHSASCVNDTLYAETLMNTIEKKLCVDRRRQYVTGMSSGGMMALWMAVQFAARLAAAVPVAGSALLGFWKEPLMSIPVMDIHGTEDATIPANQSNGFVGLGNDSTGKPLVVPGCPDCSFSDDGFYYTGNYNITHGIAHKNRCNCSEHGAVCPVKAWPTCMDETNVGRDFRWTCFESFGDCGRYPVVRCTWKGKHFLPVHGAGSKDPEDPEDPPATVKEKKNFFNHIAWEFMSQFWIEEGSEKERLLLQKP